MSDELPDKVGPVDHIARRALPWRTSSDMTECGKSADEVGGRLVSYADATARVSRIGQARASFTLCQTCWSAAANHQHDRWRWDRRSDLDAIQREIDSVARACPPMSDEDVARFDRRRLRDQETRRRDWDRRQRLELEMDAIVALVAAHRDEFDGYLAGRAETTSLADRRRGRRRTS